MDITNRHTRTITTICLALVAAPILLLGLSACSSGVGGASSTSSPRSEADTAELAEQWDLARARCMRDAGFDVSDPSGGTTGGMQLSQDTDLEALTTASETCTSTVEASLGKRPVTGADRERNAERDQYASKGGCLRDHGVDIPEVTTSGGGAAAALPDSIPQDVLKACGINGSSGAGE